MTKNEREAIEYREMQDRKHQHRATADAPACDCGEYEVCPLCIENSDGSVGFNGRV